MVFGSLNGAVSCLSHCCAAQLVVDSCCLDAKRVEGDTATVCCGGFLVGINGVKKWRQINGMNGNKWGIIRFTPSHKHDIIVV